MEGGGKSHLQYMAVVLCDSISTWHRTTTLLHPAHTRAQVTQAAAYQPPEGLKYTPWGQLTYTDMGSPF